MDKWKSTWINSNHTLSQLTHGHENLINRVEIPQSIVIVIMQSEKMFNQNGLKLNKISK